MTGPRRPALLHDLLDHAAARTPDRPALLGAGGDWTYRELLAHSHAVAAWLARRGVGRGDRVVTLVANDAVLAALLFGASRVGAAFTPLGHELTPFQLRGVLPAAAPSVVVTGGAVPGGCAAEVVPVDVLRREARAHLGTEVRRPVAPGDVALLLHTSGSTSVPKAVVCPHERVLFATGAIAARVGYTRDDRIFVRLPLSFDYGLYQLLLACHASAAVHLAEGGGVGLARELGDSGATVVPVVPSLAGMLNDLAERRPAATRVRLFTNTGAALGAAQAARLRRNFPGAAVLPMYGLTECKRVTVGEPDEDLVRPGSVGRALPGTTVEIHDEHGVPLPPGREGQIVVRGPHVMAGYRDAPEPTARRFRAGALHTGDFGRLDEAGNLYFHGRRDDIVKRRGVRLSTVEVEAAAEDVPGVRAAVATYSAHDDTLCVAVTGTVDPDEVRAGLAARLEPGKRPDHCVVLDRLPTKATGKTDRAAVAALVAETTGGTAGQRRGDP